MKWMTKRNNKSSNPIKFEDYFVRIPLCNIHHRPSISYYSLTSDTHDDCQQMICFNCLEERQTICSSSPILMKYRDFVCGSCFIEITKRHDEYGYLPAIRFGDAMISTEKLRLMALGDEIDIPPLQPNGGSVEQVATLVSNRIEKVI